MSDTTQQTTAELKRTPFTHFHEQLGAKMVPFAGFLMPVQYEGITAEHLAVRNKVGLFDLTHMGEFEVTGKDALAFLEKTTTNNVAALEPGDIQYSCMTYEHGGIVDDLLVYRLIDSYFLVVNAANLDKDFEWLSSHLFGDAKLENRSDEFGLLAIQGPDAEKMVQEMTKHDLASMKYYSSVMANVGGQEVLMSRTGYTGEDGFELYIPEPLCEAVWHEVLKAGEKYDLKPIGLGARDSLRLEMKMALYGNDIDQTTTPIEAGLSWIVNLDKQFIGKDVIARQKEEGPSRRLVCLELEGKAFPRHGYKILSGDKELGEITSGTVSPCLNKPIALGYVKAGFTKFGTEVEVEIRNKRFNAVVVKPPFYKEASHR
jgi:aminomethyltransferase